MLQCLTNLSSNLMLVLLYSICSALSSSSSSSTNFIATQVLNKTSGPHFWNCITRYNARYIIFVTLNCFKSYNLVSLVIKMRITFSVYISGLRLLNGRRRGVRLCTYVELRHLQSNRRANSSRRWKAMKKYAA